MTARADCPTCGRNVSVRMDGALRQHRNTHGAGCDSSQVNAAPVTYSPARSTPLVLDIPEAAALLRCGRTTIYELLDAGHLTGIKIGRRRLVTYASTVEFVQQLAAR